MTDDVMLVYLLVGLTTMKTTIERAIRLNKTPTTMPAVCEE